MLKKIPSDKINDTKNFLFFLSRAPTHHNETVNKIFHFRLRSVFSKVCIFVQQIAWTL